MTPDEEDAWCNAQLEEMRAARAVATEWTWDDDMSESDIFDFPKDCKITITAEQLRELIQQAYWSVQP